MESIKNTLIYYGISALQYISEFEKNLYIRYMPYRETTFRSLIPVKKIVHVYENTSDDELEKLFSDDNKFMYIDANIKTACCLYWFFNGMHVLDNHSIEQFSIDNNLDIHSVMSYLNLIIIDDIYYKLIKDEEGYFYEQVSYNCD